MKPEHAMGAVAALIEHGLYSPEVEEELAEMMDENYEPVEVDGDPQKYAEVQKMIRGLTAGKLGGKKEKSMTMTTTDSFLVAGNPPAVVKKPKADKKTKKKNCDKIAVIGQELKKSRLDFELHKP